MIPLLSLPSLQFIHVLAILDPLPCLQNCANMTIKEYAMETLTLEIKKLSENLSKICQSYRLHAVGHCCKK